MMTREERAKQFMPFDAMKGLQNALREKEENRKKVKKSILSDEVKEKLSKDIMNLKTGEKVKIIYYSENRKTEKTDTAEKIDEILKYLVIGGDIIYFDDIYSVETV